MGSTAAIVLAAGKSTRMNTDLPKVLHEVCGKPMISWVLSACRLAGAEKMIVVVGYGREQVEDRLADETDVVFVEQAEQRGTGHAVMCCREAMSGFAGSVLVLAGDMPLVRRETLAMLVQVRERQEYAMVLATTTLAEPTGYGRIVRDESGEIERIVEERDCTPEQRAIHEVNPSYYCFDAALMFGALSRVKPDNAKGEYYITDAVTVLKNDGALVSAMPGVAAEDATGINSRIDLSAVNRMMQDRLQLALMSEGVTILDPDNTWIEADVSVGRDTVIAPFAVLSAGAMVGSRCRIGPFAHVRAGQIVADGASVSGFSR